MASKALSQEYLDYIQSREWLMRRALKLLLAGAMSGRVQCEFCELYFPPNRVDVHHKSYEHFKAEPLSELAILCRLCHESVDEIETACDGGSVAKLSDGLVSRLAVIDSRLVESPQTVGPTQWMPKPEFAEMQLGELVKLLTRKRQEAGLPI